jgi:circadian clock protein KaiC
MGTLRWEKEDFERGRDLKRRAEFDHKRRELQVSEAETNARIKALQQDLERQRTELTTYSSENQARIVSSTDREKELGRIRGADPARPGANGSGDGKKGNGKVSRNAA